MSNPTIEGLNEKIWDCIVIGAGPAGAIAARQIAKDNKEVLLVDKEVFPRAKVCGCCINSSAADALRATGLGNLLAENGAYPLSAICLFNKKKSADLALTKSFSLSREKFDMALIDAGIACGVTFLSSASAKVLSLEPLPLIQIEEGKSAHTVQAKVVIIADGLSGTSLSLLSQFDPLIKSNSRFGASVILDQRPDYIKAGKIYMACGDGGYVGMVALEDGRLNVAAALSHEFSKQFKGPAAAAAHLLNDNALPVPEQLTQTHWTGTNLLTRSRQRVADTRLFVIGDASGYVEPFTGEGMAWALWSGLKVSALAIEGIKSWTPHLIKKWQQAQSELRFCQTRCQFIALALRNSTMRSILVNFCTVLPVVANPLIRIINGSMVIDGSCNRG
jgi:menaquinone-9 beta-reductase